MTRLIKTFLAVTMLSLGSGAAIAETETDNPWMIRGRIINVAPDESANLSVPALELGLVGNVDIDDSFVPELDISYFLNENVALELILGVTPHDVNGVDIEVPNVGTLSNVELGDVWLLPPTLTAQYHFTQFGAFKPYVGAGVNYTLFFNEDEGDVADSIDYDSSFGPALQLGFDYDLDGDKGGWAFNVDVKKVWINSDVTVNLTSALASGVGVEELNVRADVDINPLIAGVGMGYKY